MNEYRFEAEIAVEEEMPEEVVRERVYGDVRVTLEMGTPAVVTVSGALERRDAPAYVELFFHDLYLLLNLASPGSFGGRISVTGGELRVRELTFDARLFASVAPAATLPLADVVRWYDGLHLGTQQLATDGVAIALMQLLHLARDPESEETSILRLASAAEAVVDTSRLPVRLLELRDEIARGRVPVFHPMHDDALDPRVEDATAEWIDVADATARLVIGSLREQVTRLP